MHEEFRRVEQEVLHKIVMADTFSKQNTEYPDWEFSNFHVGGSGIDSTAEIKGNFMPANFSPSMQGLQLKYMILRSKCLVYLKSIACEIKLSIRLSGDSTLWIITRAAGVKDPDGMVCKVRKEQDT